MLFIGLTLSVYAKGTFDVRLMLVGAALALIGALAWLITRLPD